MPRKILVNEILKAVPYTFERTSFQKNKGSDSRAIMMGEFLNVKYDGLHRIIINYYGQLISNIRKNSVGAMNQN